MARILPLVEVLESTHSINGHGSSSLFFLLLDTDVTTAWTVIPPLQDDVKLAGEASWPLVGK